MTGRLAPGAPVNKYWNVRVNLQSGQSAWYRSPTNLLGVDQLKGGVELSTSDNRERGGVETVATVYKIMNVYSYLNNTERVTAFISVQCYTHKNKTSIFQ